MIDWFIVGLLAFLAVAIGIPFVRKAYHHDRFTRRKFIDGYVFPESIVGKVADKYPHLSAEQCEKVISGLREYFHVCNLAGRKMVSMPSQVVDVAWHEFILFTQKYQAFNDQAFGRFLHHTPAEAMETPTVARDGIRRAWRISCGREAISVSKPHKLPLLFALDTELNIPDGFRYSLDCESGSRRGEAAAGVEYCATHIGCSTGCSNGCASEPAAGSDGDGGCGGCGGD